MHASNWTTLKRPFFNSESAACASTEGYGGRYLTNRKIPAAAAADADAESYSDLIPTGGPHIPHRS